MSAAAQCYKATLAVTTGLSAPFNNLAIIYKQQVHVYMRFEESIIFMSVKEKLFGGLYVVAKI